MVQPRRAKPSSRPVKAVAAGVAALALVAGLLVWQPWARDAGSATPGPAAPPPSTSSASTSSTPNPSSNGSADDAAVRVSLQQCRTRTKAADAVFDRAKTGVDHWSEHVQAQNDADAGRITATQMQAIFKRTRLAGPDDVSAYKKVTTAYTSVDKTCSDDETTADQSNLAEQLNACRSRDATLTKAMTTADAAMADWTDHLAAMKRSAGGHVHNAQDIWIAAKDAAPPNLNAFDKARRMVAKAPTC